MAGALKLKSSSFKNDHEIPVRFTGEGDDISPALNWSGVPEGTHEFVIVCEDPDAPQEKPFVHWLIYNISSNTTQIPEGVAAKARLDYPVRADQGANDFGNVGYGGPMPPEGHGPHRYFFRLYALDSEVGIRPGAHHDELMKAIQNHILDSAELVGTYERKAKAKKKSA